MKGSPVRVRASALGMGRPCPSGDIVRLGLVRLPSRTPEPRKDEEEQMTKVRQFAVAVSAVGVAIGVAGCGNTVSASDIASQAKMKFNQSFTAQGKSQRVASVSC